MQMAGEQHIPLPRQRVWEALNDPEVLQACIPGCQSLERDGPNRFNAIAEIRVGPIGARFKGAVELSDIDPPAGYTLTGAANAGITGNAKGKARVWLAEDGAGTLLTYEVDAEVGGRLAQLGGPVIDATAKRLAAAFFGRLGEVIGEDGGEAAGRPQEIAGAVPTKSSIGGAAFPWIWAIVVALAIVAGFLLGQSGIAPIWVLAVGALVIAAIGAGFEAGRRGGGRP